MSGPGAVGRPCGVSRVREGCAGGLAGGCRPPGGSAASELGLGGPQGRMRRPPAGEGPDASEARRGRAGCTPHAPTGAAAGMPGAQAKPMASPMAHAVRPPAYRIRLVLAPPAGYSCVSRDKGGRTRAPGRLARVSASGGRNGPGFADPAPAHVGGVRDAPSSAVRPPMPRWPPGRHAARPDRSAVPPTRPRVAARAGPAWPTAAGARPSRAAVLRPPTGVVASRDRRRSARPVAARGRGPCRPAP